MGLSHKFTFWGFQILLIFLMGCSQNDSYEEVLDKVEEKLSKTSTIAYKYTSKVDNKFNETSYTDSAEIFYYKIENSLYGFGLHALSNSEEYFYDGYHFEKLKHSDKIRVVYEKDDIEKDSNYFQKLSFFSTNPLMIKDNSDFFILNDTIIKGGVYYRYKNERQTISKSDSSKIVTYQKIFYVDPSLMDINWIQDIIIRNEDTLQIVDHFFENYVYDESLEQRLEANYSGKFQYKTISEKDEYEAFSYVPIKRGEVLSRKNYKDVNGVETNIYGDDQKSSLIIFSFIGCAACEEALTDFAKADYKFTDKVNLYYSSFQNPSSTLKKYLAKKGFPYQSFGKESKMIEAFSLYHGPSFVLIDSAGKVREVMEGYDEEVKKRIFEILRRA